MKQPQTLGIEYEITDLPTDAGAEPQGPARPERFVDQDVAHLSGGLFDGLPRVEVPLDTFLPVSPASLRPPRAPTFDLPPLPPSGSLVPPRIGGRVDSLYPTSADVPPPPPITARAPAFPWGQTAVASVAGVVLAVVLMRPSPGSQAPAAAPPPSATVPAAALSPVAAPLPVEPATALDTAPITPAASPATPAAAPAPHPAEPRSRSAAPTTPVQAAPAQPAPVEPAPSQELAPSPTVTADALHRASIDPPGLPPQRAAIAIAAAARGSAGCLDPDDLRRTMAVSVTFAPSGQATRATIDGGPHRGTAAGSCIAQRLRTAVVQPFEGAPVTIHTSITAR